MNKDVLFLTRDFNNGGEAIFIQKLRGFLQRNTSYNCKVVSILGTKKELTSNNTEEDFLNAKVIFNETIPSFREYSTIIKEFKKVDLITIFPYGWQSTIHYIIALFINKKVVTAVHTNMVGRFGLNYFYNVISKFFVTNIMVLVSNNIVFITKAQLVGYKKFCLLKNKFDKISIIIPNFIEDNLILEEKSLWTGKVLFVGRLKKSKGFDDLLPVIKSFERDVDFLVIGEGVLSKRLKDVTNVTYFGKVKNDKIITYYDQSDIFILPSYAEVWPMTILEAMARGLVVLVSDIPGMREIVQEGRNGYLFQPGDVVKMKELITFLKNNPKEVERISKNNLEDIRKYTAEKIVPRYVQIYESLIGS